MQFHRLDKILRASETLCEIEARIDVALSNINDLSVDRYGALTGSVKGSFPTLFYGFERFFGALIHFTRLGYALFCKGAH